MSGVHMAKSFPPSLGMPARDVQAMQDVLYDILATGLDPEQAQIPLDAIERFLHEHARNAKSIEDFRAFFAQHGLTLTTRAIKPPPVALPPIERPMQDDPPVAKFPVELARPEPLPQGAGFARQLPDELELALKPRRAQPWVWAALILLAGGVSAAAYHGYSVITRLEHRLEQADSASRSDRVALDELKTKTAGLESHVAASGEEIQRVDDKSNMIIQSLIIEQTRKSRKSY
jgi:hypothetical protein